MTQQSQEGQHFVSFKITILSAVDYPSTTSYYWPDIAENVTQVFGQVKNATKCNSEL